MLPKADQWLDTAVSEIIFAPDRKKVRQELADHLEDRMADLQRIFPDIPEEEAQTRALAGMGDAEEVKTQLARVHRPWMGWLWRGSQWALWLLTMGFCLFNMGSRIEYDFSNSLRGRSGTEVYHRVRDGEKARMGQYTFQITGAAYVDTPEDGVRKDRLQLVLRAASPRFWERANWEGIYRSLTAIGPDGTRYPMDRQDILMSREENIYQIYTGADACEWDIFWREVAVYIPAEGWSPGDIVTLELESPLGKIALSAPVTEKVVLP